MREPRLLVLVLVAASGGGGSSNTSPDAAGSGSGTPDAPAAAPDAPSCAPGAPTKLVMASGGVDSPSWTNGLVMTPSGEIAVFFENHGGGESAQVWDGSAWATKVVYATSNGGAAGMVATAADDHPAWMATPSDPTPDSQKLRLWVQLAAGDFSTGQTLGQGSPLVVSAARYWPATKVLSAVGGDGNEKTVYSAERGSGGNWNIQYVHSVSSQTALVNGAGVGAFADGTAGIVTVGSEGVWLYRRAGATWSGSIPLVAGTVQTEGVAEFPPDGSPATHAVVVYMKYPGNLPRVVFASTTDGQPTGDTSLLNQSLQDLNAQVVFQPGKDAGTILLYDYQAGTVWTADWSGTSVAPAKQLRPDLVFEGQPRLLQHPCGGLMILHATRAPADAPGSASLVIEPLSTFAP